MSEFNKHLGLFIAVILVTFLLIGQIVQQTAAYVDQLEGKADKQEQVYQEVATLSNHLLASHQKGGKTKTGRRVITSLLPWLEKETTRASMTAHVREIAPLAMQSTESGLFREKATLAIAEISMDSALRFLQQLESVIEIRIVRGDLRRSEKEAGGVILAVDIGLL